MDKIAEEAQLTVETINDLINFKLWSDNFLSENQLKRMESVSHLYLLEFLSNGDSCCIEFLGIQLWNSEDDEREYDDDKDDFAESVEKFVYTEMVKIIYDLQLIEKCMLEKE